MNNLLNHFIFLKKGGRWRRQKKHTRVKPWTSKPTTRRSEDALQDVHACCAGPKNNTCSRCVACWSSSLLPPPPRNPKLPVKRRQAHSQLEHHGLASSSCRFGQNWSNFLLFFFVVVADLPTFWCFFSEMCERSGLFPPPPWIVWRRVLTDMCAHETKGPLVLRWPLHMSLYLGVGGRRPGGKWRHNRFILIFWFLKKISFSWYQFFKRAREKSHEVDDSSFLDIHIFFPETKCRKKKKKEVQFWEGKRNSGEFVQSFSSQPSF